MTDTDLPMTDDEIAPRAAINVSRDTIESRRMPSGLPLEPDAAELHERAARRLEGMLRRGAASPTP
jgi:hypothetical protein